MAEQNPTRPVPDGYYWFEFPNGDFDIISIEAGEISVYDGDDRGYRLDTWPDCYGQPVLEGRLIGRIPEPGPIDHADLLRRYVALVVSAEGFDFLSRVGDGPTAGIAFTPAEIEHLAALSAAASEGSAA